MREKQLNVLLFDKSLELEDYLNLKKNLEDNFILCFQELIILSDIITLQLGRLVLLP